MERELLLTGIGGQGIQLAAKSLANAAIRDGLRTQLSASYGGMMRGGNSDSTLIVSPDPVLAPPRVTSAWAGFVMHPAHAERVFAAVRSGGVCAVNTSVVPEEQIPVDGGYAVLRVPAVDLASDLGTPVAASLVLAAALVAATGLVRAESLIAACGDVLPSYRSDALAANRAATEAGLALEVDPHLAWEPGQANERAGADA